MNFDSCPEVIENAIQLEQYIDCVSISYDIHFLFLMSPFGNILLYILLKPSLNFFPSEGKGCIGRCFKKSN